VPAATLGKDYYHYDERRHSMVGSRTGETFQLGDLVKVKLAEAHPHAGALRFEIISEGRYTKPSGVRAGVRGRKDTIERRGPRPPRRGK